MPALPPIPDVRRTVPSGLLEGPAIALQLDRMSRRRRGLSMRLGKLARSSITEAIPTRSRGLAGRKRGLQHGKGALCVEKCVQMALESGAPGRTRTYNPRLRRPVLYPVELRALGVWRASL